MAIDYKKEWEELGDSYGAFGVNIPHEALSVKLRALMNNQIKRTIGKRESLMKEYLKAGMRTDITGADKHCHYVDIRFHKHVYGNIAVSKAGFDAWCKKKGGK